jgi:phospholipid/cholesterol/gamma-HCH transport system permease protein
MSAATFRAVVTGDALVIHAAVDDARADFSDADRGASALPKTRRQVVEVRLAPGPLGPRGAAVLDRFCSRLEADGARVRVVPADESQRAALESHAETPATATHRGAEAAGPGFIEATLRAALLLRETLARGLGGFLYPGRSRRDPTLAALVDVGVRALPLTFLLNFVIGGVLALQAGPFFARYGQEILVAQLVAMAQLREIGPLLTAILVAGRTASSLAAEIGAMKQAEEIDALRVLGTSPVDALVVPRFRALLCGLPILTLLADLAGVAGGLLVGSAVLGLSAEAWIEQTVRASRLQDVVGGVAKAAAFAAALTTVAAYQGFAADGGAAGVGRRTTRAVVFGILAVVLVDALFTLVLYGMEA